MDELLLLGAIMTAGFIAGSLAEGVGIPRIAAYVAVGAVFSESVAGSWMPVAPGVWTDIITDGALGIIAFLIGAEFDTDALRRQARSVTGVVVGQSLGVILFVTLALALAPGLLSGLIQTDVGWNAALVFSVLAVATAPAGTLAVIEEYCAEGRLTTTLMGIIAIDDALAVALFALAIGLAGQAGLSTEAAEAAREIGLALVVGAAAGAALGWFAHYIHQGDLRLPIIIAAILLNTGLSGLIGYTDLLSNIVMGYVAMRAFEGSQKQWLEPMQHIRDTIFLLFFTLAGTHFKPGAFVEWLPLIVLYIVARAAGKIAGAAAGAAAVGAKREVRRWSGLALMPQAGVAIGLALKAASEPGLEQVSSLLLNVIISSTIVFALTAPELTKLALRKSGEISRKKPSDQSETA